MNKLTTVQCPPKKAGFHFIISLRISKLRAIRKILFWKESRDDFPELCLCLQLSDNKTKRDRQNKGIRKLNLITPHCTAAREGSELPKLAEFFSSLTNIAVSREKLHRFVSQKIGFKSQKLRPYIFCIFNSGFQYSCRIYAFQFYFFYYNITYEPYENLWKSMFCALKYPNGVCDPILAHLCGSDFFLVVIQLMYKFGTNFLMHLTCKP